MTALVVVQCPDWCEIDDHDEVDGSAVTRHEMSYGVELSALPYEVPGCARAGRTAAQHHEEALVVLRQDGNGSVPVIAIQMPEPRDEPNPVSG